MQTLALAEIKRKSPVVVQSNQLVESRYSLTVGEQRLVYAMISLINPDDIDFKPYVLKIQDLAFFLNIDLKNAYREADKITSRIMERVLHIPQENGDLLKVHWVSSALHKKGSVELQFNPKMKPYLLQLKERFTGSQLVIVNQFQSFYTIRIYNLLKQYRKIGYREIGLAELREILGIDDSKYPDFKQFRAWVLNQAKKEFETKLHGGSFKSDLTFDLETIREGRKITRVKFIIKNQSYQEELPMTYSNEPTQIAQMVYFGISEKQAFELYQEYGDEQTQNALDLYGQRVAEGKVKKQSGGYLLKLIKEGAGGKSAHEKEQETKAKEKALAAQKIEKQKAKIKEAEAKKIADEAEAHQAQFDALGESEKTAFMERFEKDLKIRTMRDKYRESGLNNPMVKGHFRNFLKAEFSG